MKFRPANSCRFCSDTHLEPTPTAPNRLLRMLCLEQRYCPHCFDVYLSPVLPALATVAFWVVTYVGLYLFVATPVEVVNYEWPDERAPVVTQTIFKPLIDFDPRVQELRMDRDFLRKPVRRQVPFVAERDANSAVQ